MTTKSEDTQRDRRALEIFGHAVEMAGTGALAGYLDDACGGDSALKARVEVLLSHHVEDSFLEMPAAGQGSSAGTALREQPGDRIDRYKLLEKIGEGGCGVVYMAEQEEPVRRRVALKIIKPGMDSREVIARFEAERQALALMDHPNIAKVFDGGVTGGGGRTEDRGRKTHDGSQRSDVGGRLPTSDLRPLTSDIGRPFFVMELVRGVRITDYCQEHALSTRERLDLFTAVCSAVQHAHQKGIIHRDLKPSNILVTELDGKAVPKVIDFGIARATEQKLTDKTLFTQFAQFIGTPAYMSPEQAAMSGADIDTRSDIYSLGVLLYELLTGTTPFDAKELLRAGFDEMRRIIRESEPPRPSTRLTQSARITARPPVAPSEAGGQKSEVGKRSSSLPTDLDWIVMKCLEKDRARRYETASGLAQDIQRHLTSEPVIARPASAAYRFRKMVRRNRVAFAAGSVVAAALVIGLSVSTWMFFNEKRARKDEKRALERATAAEMAQSEERKKAETEAGKSRQVTALLRQMLQGVGPSVAQGDDPGMLRRILDQTAEQAGSLRDQPEVEAELRTILGKVYHDLAEYEKAGASLDKALLITRGLRGEDHPDIAALLSERAMTLRQQGGLAEAEEMLREGLAMRRKSGGPQEDVTTFLNNLGAVLADQGKTVEAEKVHREALAMNRRLSGTDHEHVGISLNNLAIVVESQGKFAESESMLREALAIQRARVGDGTPDVATTLNNLANVVRKQNRPAEAELLFREVLARQRKLLGSAHPNVAAALNGLGLVLLDLGRSAEAEPLLREGVEIEKKVRKSAHPQSGRLVGNLGRVMEDLREHAEAEALYREALAIYAKLPKEPHSDVIHWRNRLFNLLQNQGRSQEMETILREDLESARSVVNSDPSRLDTCLDDLAKHLYRAGKFAEAEPCCRELLANRKARPASEHDTVLGAMSLLGLVLADRAWLESSSKSVEDGIESKLLSRAREAESLLRECLALWLSSPRHKEGHWTTDELRGRLGRALAVAAAVDTSLTSEEQLAKFNEAEALLLESARALGSNGRVGRKYRRDAFVRLVRLYEAWRQPAKAAEWREKAAAFDKTETDKSPPAHRATSTP
jgi:serine/threonine protein kinase/tetratricopeptide (TPR) repeat protein